MISIIGDIATCAFIGVVVAIIGYGLSCSVLRAYCDWSLKRETKAK